MGGRVIRGPLPSSVREATVRARAAVVARQRRWCRRPVISTLQSRVLIYAPGRGDVKRAVAAAVVGVVAARHGGPVSVGLRSVGADEEPVV